MAQPISVSLQPFEATHHTAAIAIESTVVRQQNRLTINYRLTGDRSGVSLPPATAQPGAAGLRQMDLWEATCFEFFLACGSQHSKDRPYWEFNLSPSGAWNAFSLSGYRQGLTESSAIAALPFDVKTSARTWQLKLTLDLEPLIAPVAAPDSPICMGISAVVLFQYEAASQQESFWAIAHPGPEADFHHPDSFVLHL